MAYKKSNPNGQATMANSEPVVIASNQTAIPVSATDLDIRPLVNTDVVTAELSATDNAVLDAIAASVAAIDTDTTTIIGHVDGIETLLTSIEGDTSAIQTSVQLIDDTVATLGTDTYTETTTKGLVMGAVRRDANTTLVGTTNEVAPLQVNATGELKVAQIQALPAGTNNIGDVDVLSIIPGTAATNLGKARDSAIGATDTGIAMLGVRRDAPTAETPIAGDYVVPQVSANGEQWVRLAGELADDAAFTVGTTRVLPVGLLADETSTDSVDEGDIGVARMTLDRKQIVTSYPSATGTAEGLLVANFNTGDTYTALTNSAQVIKATAGNLYGYYIYNPNSAATYVMIYNIAAASVTVGTSTAQMVFCIPATSGANLMFPYPISFTNAGWSIAAATTGGGNSAPATALEAMIWYR